MKIACRKCQSAKVMVESAGGDGKVRVTCQECGFASVMDQQGRMMLTDDAHSSKSMNESVDTKRLLTEVL